MLNRSEDMQIDLLLPVFTALLLHGNWVEIAQIDQFA